MGTTADKFQSAMLALASPGSIKDRLSDAYRNHLATLTEDDLPAELREDFRAIGEALTREQPLIRGEDSLRATIRKMSSHEAAEIACMVVRLYGAVSSANAASVRGKPAKAGNVVPLYLAEA